MSKLPLNRGRIQQKLNTRRVILEATKQLMKKHKKITLEDVAKEAKISRATTYRYYSNIDVLITEASLDIHHVTPEEIYEKIKDKSVSEKIFYIQNYYNHLAETHEVGFRKYLSSVLNEPVTSKRIIRGARRISALQKALEPLKGTLNDEELDKLINISGVLMGIDALVICKDVCGLNNKKANELLHWGMEMILKGLLSDKKVDE